MAVNLNRSRNVQISKSQEAAYDSAATVDQLIKANASVIIQEKVDVSDDRDLIGGLEEADEQTVLAKHVELTLAQSKCRPHTLALVAAYAMGSVLTSLVGTNTYKHGFTPTTSFTTLPSATMETLLKTGVQYKYSGMFCDSFQLEVSRGADRRVSITSSWMGSATRASGVVAASEQAESALNAATAGFWIAATTYAGTTGDALDVATDDLTAGVARKTDLLELSWSYSNNVDPDFLYEIGGGLGFGSVSRVAREQTLTATLLFDDYSEVDWMLNQTDLAVQLMIQGDEEDTTPSRYEGFNLIFPKTRLTVADTVERDGRIAVNCEFAILQDSTHGSVLLDVFTLLTSYLT